MEWEDFNHLSQEWIWFVAFFVASVLVHLIIRSIVARRWRIEVGQSLLAWDDLTNYQRGYFNNYALCEWMEACPQPLKKMWRITLPFLVLPWAYKNDLKALKQIYRNANDLRETYNEEFLKHELDQYDSLFSSIEGSNLDEQQRIAATINEDNNLVIAGAGSGKTKTIMAKIAYLFDKHELDPNKLMLISFTNKSCDEMKERLKRLLDEPPEVKTFHKLGLDIIKQVEAENHPNVASFSQKQFFQILQSFFEAEKENEEYQKLYNTFFIEYLTIYKDPAEFDSEDELFQYLNQIQNYSYKVVSETDSKGKKITYREKLKSQEEVYIANFLYFNNVDYEYEAKFKHETTSKKHSQYCPDFYLPKYDIYIEHFAVDKNNNVPKWFSGTEEKSGRQVYVEGMRWKRTIHKNFQTTLVETYSWEQKDGVLLDNLKSKLEELGVIFNPVSEEEKGKIIKRALKNEIAGFINLVGTFITLFKANNMSYSDLQVMQFPMNFLNIRNKVFLELFKPVFEAYQMYLEEKHVIDFSDMINRASEHVANNRFAHEYEYILVDEFQDISAGRLNLLNKLVEHSPQTRLFCVGDDWQSIYRFTGSDTTLITDYERIWKKIYEGQFSRETRTQKIETTYRFPPSMIDLSSNFILKNPRQVSKVLKSGLKNDNGEVSSWSVHRYDSNTDYRRKVFEILGQLTPTNNGGASVLFLGRYNHDREVISKTLGLNLKYQRDTGSYSIESGRFSFLDMKFLTIHSAKGLEAEYVIMLNVNEGKFGFPSEINDDPILSMVLSSDQEYDNAEERRIFYVGLTRARIHTHLMVDKNWPSKFANEITGETLDGQIIWCRRKKCDGRMIKREGEYGPFLGCTNYPKCKNIKQIINGK